MSSPSTSAPNRLAQWRDELRAGGERGDVEKVLVSAGALLRRSEGLSVDVAEVTRVVQRLSPEAVKAWLNAREVKALESRLSRAADEAVEALFPDSSGDRGFWESWALQGLLERDRLESALRACERGFASRADLATELQRRRAELEQADQRMRPKARWWVGLNASRRAEGDLLNVDERATAWWFFLRAECDDLLPALAGELSTSAHLSGCAACQRDVEAAGAVSEPRGRHLDAEDLWRLDMGLATDAQRKVAQHHASGCPECRRALLALKEGEEEIGEAAEHLAVLRALPTARRARHRQPDEVVDELPAFRVLLHRRPTRWQLVVQPAGAQRLAAVAAFLEAAPRSPLKPRQSAEGLTFELGDPPTLEGSSVTLRVQYGHELYERDIEL